MPNSEPERRSAPHCDLGVTGKRLRQALPAVPPSASFREQLKRAIGSQLLALDAGPSPHTTTTSAGPEPIADR